jgi:acyl-CoA reductase-like NAD-dependent aldehyde dehydrogenase
MEAEQVLWRHSTGTVEPWPTGSLAIYGNRHKVRVAAVWTRDVSKAHRMARSIRAGSVWVNCYQAMDPAVPFGGYKMSGYGRESGLQHVEEYLNVKAVWIKTA